jgi:lipopolysaccharide biosynthesis regulator YciM
MELLFLLLPLAALSGWMVGRRNSKKPSGYTDKLSKEYFRGINYLLNDDQDQALDVFVKMLEIDSEAVEIHMALGNLFRKRGEVERSIRIHQNLIARPSLSPDQREQALFELAQDYMKAGLLDRAESLYQQVSEKPLYAKQANQNLLLIYQAEKDWDNAIKVGFKQMKMGVEGSQSMVAHFICEQADAISGYDNLKKKRKLYIRAQNVDRTGVRPFMQEADLLYKTRQFKPAIKKYKTAIYNGPEYKSEIIPKLKECYRQIGNMADFERLEKELHKLKSQVGIDKGNIIDINSRRSANNENQLPIENINEAMNTLHVLTNQLSSEPEIVRELKDVESVINSIAESRSQYKCVKCGFKAQSLHWLCPSCHSWGSIKPNK